MSIETRIVDQVKWVGVVPAKMGTLTLLTAQQINGTTDLFTVPAGQVYRVFSSHCFHVNAVAAARVGFVSIRNAAGSRYFLHYAAEIGICAAKATVCNFSVPLEMVAADFLRINSSGTDMTVVVSICYEPVILGGVS